MVMVSVAQSYLVHQIVRTVSTGKLFIRAGQSLVEGQTCRELSLFGSYVTKHRGEAAKWQPFQELFVFYSEPANQKPTLVVSGPRKDANPSVNDKLHSYTCPGFGAHSVLLDCRDVASCLTLPLASNKSIIIFMPYWVCVGTTASVTLITNTKLRNLFIMQTCTILMHAVTKALSRATMKCTLNKRNLLISDVCLITYHYGITIKKVHRSRHKQYTVCVHDCVTF